MLPSLFKQTVCKIFAIAIQYFFVTSFAWVCNEAFNLYIEVANSIHADTQQQRPMLRYYVIGWCKSRDHITPTNRSTVSGYDFRSKVLLE